MQRPFIPRLENGWDGVPKEGYAPDQPGVVVRNTLVGRRKETPEAPGPALELRYFEVPAGAATRLEKHEHEHVVIGGEGLGHAIVGTEVREVRPHDVVYVAPLQPHQFVNRAEQPFGFYCIVPAHRDPGRPIGAEEEAARPRRARVR